MAVASLNYSARNIYGTVGFVTAFGLGLAAFLELTDVRFRHENDLEGILPARMLVGIPRLSTPREEHSRLIARYVECGAVAFAALLIFTGNLYVYYNG